MGFWERYVAECNRVGVKPHPLAKEVGVSSGAVTGWKKLGSIPSGDVMLRLAERLGVTASYLLGEDEKSATLHNGQPVDKALLALESEIKGLHPDDVREAAVFVAYLKSKRKR